MTVAGSVDLLVIWAMHTIKAIARLSLIAALFVPVASPAEPTTQPPPLSRSQLKRVLCKGLLVNAMTLKELSPESKTVDLWLQRVFGLDLNRLPETFTLSKKFTQFRIANTVFDHPGSIDFESVLASNYFQREWQLINEMTPGRRSQLLGLELARMQPGRPTPNLRVPDTQAIVTWQNQSYTILRDLSQANLKNYLSQLDKLRPAMKTEMPFVLRKNLRVILDNLTLSFWDKLAREVPMAAPLSDSYTELQWSLIDRDIRTYFEKWMNPRSRTIKVDYLVKSVGEKKTKIHPRFGRAEVDLEWASQAGYMLPVAKDSALEMIRAFALWRPDAFRQFMGEHRFYFKDNGIDETNILDQGEASIARLLPAEDKHDRLLSLRQQLHKLVLTPDDYSSFLVRMIEVYFENLFAQHSASTGKQIVDFIENPTERLLKQILPHMGFTHGWQLHIPGGVPADEWTFVELPKFLDTQADSETKPEPILEQMQQQQQRQYRPFSE